MGCRDFGVQGAPGGHKIQFCSGAAVDFVLYLQYLLICKYFKIGAFGDVLANEFVGILNATLLP